MGIENPRNMITMVVIDDERHIREGLESLDWSSIGILFSGTASDSSTGATLIREVRPDIVISDIRMPGINGVELSKIIRRELPLTRILLLTGYQTFDHAREAVRLGIDDFLLKPTSPQELFDAVSKVKAKVIEERKRRNNESKIAIEIATSRNLIETHRLQQKYDDHVRSQMEVSAGYMGDNEIVLRVLSFLESDYHRAVSIKEIAQKVNLNADYLGRVLKKETGSTFSELLQDIRLREAIRLLRFTQLTIYEISEKIGLADSDYFSRLFKRTYGMTPSDFRNDR